MIILELVQNLALLVALAVVCQLIEAWWRTRRLTSQLFHGLLFGGVGVLSMMTPVHFMPGIIFDGRSIILGVGGLFGGPVVALISALLCGAYRLWVGGAGAPVGLGVIFESAALGAAFHCWRRRTARPLGLLELWSFGLLVHGVMLGLMLLLPGGARQAVWNQFGLAIIGVYPVATMLICRLFLDYEKQWRDRIALQESEDKFKCFFEHSNVGQSITRPSGELQVNQAFCDLLGYSPAELRQQSWQAITHPEDRELTQRVMDGLLAGKQDSARLTKRFLHKNGSVVWADVSTALRRDPAGQPLYFMTAVIDITKRQQAEAEVARSREQYRRAITAANAIPYQKDYASDTYVFMGEGIRELTGYAPSELRSAVWKEMVLETEFLGEAAGLGATEAARRAVTGEIKNWRADHRIRARNGEIRWLSDSSISVLDANGKYAGSMGILQDITERKRAEALKETLLSLTTRLSVASTALDAARGVFAATDRLWQWEAGALDVCLPDGATVETVLCVDAVEGERREMPPSGTPNNRSPRVRRIMAHGAELILRTPEEMKVSDSVPFGDTSRLSASLMCVPIRKRGQPVGILSIQSYRPNAFTPADLETLQGLADHCGGALERIGAEAELRETTERLRLAQRAGRIGIWDHDFKTQRTVWTPEQEALFGYAPGTYAGTPMLFEEIVHADDRPRLAQAIARALETGSFDLEFRATRLDGALRWFAGHGQIYRDAAGRPARMIGINFDITEQKQLEANFLRIQRMEGIGALAGGIAHDLNNILAPILMVGPLLRETVTDPESRHMIDTVEGCAQRGADIIKQLLTFARGKPGARAPLPVRHLLNEMHKLIRETFPRNIQPRVNVPKDLWQILGDATQIQQALMNLCVNARDALPEGGTLTLAAENVTLDTTAASLAPEAKPGEYVRVSVADTGTGIAPEHLDRIFDPFFTTKEIGKGTGLGLATVLGIVLGHGGFVRVNSQMGQGTTFELYLPASPEAEAAATPAAEALPRRGQGELILAVDDEASVREIIRHTLEKFGYRVIVAGEGAEALALFGQHPEIKAVITDMMMPGMDGPKLVGALRQLNARLPIVGMTGLAERAGVKGLEALNLPAVLNKPFAVVSLLTALHDALGKSVC